MREQSDEGQVHGAWADGSSWSKVISLLQAKGINAVAVQLTQSTLAADVATVKRAIAHARLPRPVSVQSIGLNSTDQPMCGRYVSPDDASIEREFNLVRAEWQFPPSYNVAPTQDVPVVRVNEKGEHAGSRMHWGLIPFWAKGIQPKYSTINATVEKLKDGATWRGPWKRGQRCIMPALGFYEWQVLPDGKSKQPYYLTLNDQDIFGFAALWDSSKRDDGTTIESCTIVTMPANQLMTEIHNVKHRMPAILAKETRDTWLTGTPDEAFAVIRQYPDAHMVATPVSKRVNTPKNNDAGLIERTGTD